MGQNKVLERSPSENQKQIMEHLAEMHKRQAAEPSQEDLDLLKNLQQQLRASQETINRLVLNYGVVEGELERDGKHFNTVKGKKDKKEKKDKPLEKKDTLGIKGLLKIESDFEKILKQLSKDSKESLEQLKEKKNNLNFVEIITRLDQQAEKIDELDELSMWLEEQLHKVKKSRFQHRFCEENG